MSDEQIEMPEGWVNVCLGDILERIEAGKSVLAEGRPAKVDEFGVLKVSAVSWGEFQPQENKALPSSKVSRSIAPIQAGDLLISRANTVELVGAVVLVKADYPNLLLSDKTLRIVPYSQIVLKEFLLYALRTRSVRNLFEDQATGTSDSMRNLSQDKIRSAPIFIPPFNEQKRIVAKIEELNDRHQRTKQALEAIPELCDRFRQSVLAAAFRGDLTADWREENPDVESASVLLERIRRDRRQRWENFELDRMIAQNKHPKNDDWKRKYPELDLVENDIEISIPDSWMLLPLSLVTDVLRPISYGILKPGDYFEDGIPMLRIVDIKNGEIDFSNVHKVSEELSQEYKRTLLYGGEVVISLVGTIGLVAEVPKVISKVNIHRNLGLIPPSQFIRSKFLIYWLKSPYVREYLLSVTTGANQPLLNLADVKSLPIPVPPIDEQDLLVERLETQLATINKVDQALSCCNKHLNNLNQSILAKAFRGELVEQDPNDEPASVLLDRIRAEREKLQGNKKSGSARGKRKKAADNQLGLPGVN